MYCLNVPISLKYLSLSVTNCIWSVNRTLQCSKGLSWKLSYSRTTTENSFNFTHFILTSSFFTNIISPKKYQLTEKSSSKFFWTKKLLIKCWLKLTPDKLEFIHPGILGVQAKGRNINSNHKNVPCVYTWI